MGIVVNMRAYVKYRDPLSFAINRVIAALKEYAPPEVEFTDDWKSADLVVYHATGRLEKIEQESKIAKSYAVIQYTLRGSRHPFTGDWIPLWQDAAVVWSYLDLAMMTKDDGVTPDFIFYHAPLGVDNRIFQNRKQDRYYAICTSGGLYTTEGVRECHHAARDLGQQIVHLGPSYVGRGKDFNCYREVDDDVIVGLYNQCRYVAGLRRNEGFELPAAEGLLCGARPIMFDSPHYKRWYYGLAEFIPENGRPEMIENIKAILNKEYRPVTDYEMDEARTRFNWKNIIAGFWRRCLR